MKFEKWGWNCFTEFWKLGRGIRFQIKFVFYSGDCLWLDLSFLKWNWSFTAQKLP
jgi:hypothetical protein